MLVLDGNGKEIDWIAGYQPPPEKLLKRIQTILAGIDTVPALEKARAKDPKDPEPLIKLGLKFQARQDRAKALRLFREAATLDPDGMKTLVRESGETVSCRELAEFHHAQTFVTTFGLYDIDAVRDFIRAHPSSPLLKEAYTAISRFYRLEDGEGRAFLNEFVSRFPTDPDVLKIYIDKAGQLRDPAGAEEVVRRGLALAERVGEIYPSTTVLEATKSLAELALDRQDPARAESAYGPDLMKKQTGSWADALLTYAEFWLGQKRNQVDAQASIEKALSLAPDDPGVLRRAASAYHIYLGRTAKALEIYGPGIVPKIADSAQELYSYFKFWTTFKINLESAEDALASVWRIKPDSVYYRIGAANVYVNAKQPDRALALFGPDFASARQDDMAALYEYGMFWTRQSQNLESALAALTRALRTSPIGWTNHWGAAQIMAKLKRPELALQVFGPDYLPQIAEDVDALAVYANFWGGQNTNKDSALEALEMALHIKDVPAWQLSTVAFSFIKAGRPDRVDEFYGPERLAAIGDDAMSLLYYAGFWFRQGRNLPSALAAIERACQVKKESSENWLLRARILQRLDRPADALKSVDQAIALDEYGDKTEELRSLRRSILDALGKLKK
jgi:tetratricopeptide (TPR) repeat protein